MIERERVTERWRNREAEKQGNRERERETDKQIDRNKEIEREREKKARMRERERERWLFCQLSRNKQLTVSAKCPSRNIKCSSARSHKTLLVVIYT